MYSIFGKRRVCFLERMVPNNCRVFFCFFVCRFSASEATNNILKQSRKKMSRTKVVGTIKPMIYGCFRGWKQKITIIITANSKNTYYTTEKQTSRRLRCIAARMNVGILSRYTSENTILSTGLLSVIWRVLSKSPFFTRIAFITMFRQVNKSMTRFYCNFFILSHKKN